MTSCEGSSKIGGKLKPGWQEGIKRIRERDEDEKAMEGLTPLERIDFRLDRLKLLAEQAHRLIQRINI